MTVFGNPLRLTVSKVKSGMIAICVLLIGLPLATNAQEPPLYKDATQPVEARIDDLISRMTLEEKIAQITTIWQSRADSIQSASYPQAEK